MENAVEDAFNKDSRGRPVQVVPTGQTLITKIQGVLSAYLPDDAKGREVELLGESVEEGFRKVVESGRELTFEQLNAVELYLQGLQPKADEG